MRDLDCNLQVSFESASNGHWCRRLDIWLCSYNPGLYTRNYISDAASSRVLMASSVPVKINKACPAARLRGGTFEQSMLVSEAFHLTCIRKHYSASCSTNEWKNPRPPLESPSFEPHHMPALSELEPAVWRIPGPCCNNAAETQSQHGSSHSGVASPTRTEWQCWKRKTAMPLVGQC